MWIPQQHSFWLRVRLTGAGPQGSEHIQILDKLLQSFRVLPAASVSLPFHRRGTCLLSDPGTVQESHFRALEITPSSIKFGLLTQQIGEDVIVTNWCYWAVYVRGTKGVILIQPNTDLQPGLSLASEPLNSQLTSEIGGPRKKQETDNSFWSITVSPHGLCYYLSHLETSGGGEFCLSWRLQLRIGTSLWSSVTPECCSACLDQMLSKGVVLGQHRRSRVKGETLSVFSRSMNLGSKKFSQDGNSAMYFSGFFCQLLWGFDYNKITLLSHFAC